MTKTVRNILIAAAVLAAAFFLSYFATIKLVIEPRYII